MKLHEKIYQHRKQLGLSQEQLAEQLGVTRQAVSKWELRSSLPELEYIVSLAKVFGVTTDYLLDAEEASTQTTASPKQDWLDRLPGFIGRMFRRYGWLLGIYIAVAGGLFAGMGTLIRYIAKQFNATANSMLQGFPGFVGSLGGMQQQMGNMIANDPILSIGTAVQVFGLLLLVGGIILAFVLKKKGK
jgi:transcriptional regulator with XRE-family HTH domain